MPRDAKGDAMGGAMDDAFSFNCGQTKPGIISRLAEVSQKEHLVFLSETSPVDFHCAGRRFILARCCENNVKHWCLRTAMAQEYSRGPQVEAAYQKINSGLIPDLLFGCQAKNEKNALLKKHAFSYCFYKCKNNGVAQGGHFSFQAFRSFGKGLPKWSPRALLENRNQIPRHRFCGPCDSQKYSLLCTPPWF